MNQRTLKRISVVAIVLTFAWTMYTTITWLISKKDPGWTEERKKEFAMGTIASSKVLSSVDSAMSSTIAMCMTDKIAEEYTYSAVMLLDAQLKSGDSSMVRRIQELTAECMTPFLQEIELQRKITECRDKFHAKKSSLPDSVISNYCDCFLTYLYDKYGTFELNDSIVRSEKGQATDCMGLTVDSTNQ